MDWHSVLTRRCAIFTIPVSWFDQLNMFHEIPLCQTGHDVDDNEHDSPYAKHMITSLPILLPPLAASLLRVLHTLL